jgi:hypothetical protein
MKNRCLAIAIVVFLMTATVFTVAAKPAKIGDIIGKIYKTDIATYINGSRIESYNIGGRTVIPVEELKKFGFNVTWDAQNRTLKAEQKTLPQVSSQVPGEPEKLDFSSKENTSVISGRVMLPQGEVAPKGGYNITVKAAINPNPGSNEILKGNHPIDINFAYLTVPEGKSYVDYQLPVLLKYQDYEPSYFVFFWCMSDTGVKAYGNYPVSLDMKTGAKTNIDYTFKFK